MTVMERIDHDYIQAMKQRDQDRVRTLSYLRAQIKNARIDATAQKKEFTEQECWALIRREIKKRDEAAAAYEKGGRQDLAEKEKQEADLLREYLPAPLSEEELMAVIEAVMQETGATTEASFGRVMKEVMARVGARADGKTVSQCVKKRLSGS